MKNPIFELIEDSILSVLETDTGAFLPDEFAVEIEDAAFVQLLKGLVYTTNQKPVPPTLKRVLLEIQDRKVTVRSDKDPEAWAVVPLESVIH